MPRSRLLSAETFVLEMLREGENYGGGIVEEILERTRGSVTIAYGSLYPILNKLEKEGLVRHNRVEYPDAAPARKYYELTPEGVAIATSNRVTFALIFHLYTDKKR